MNKAHYRPDDGSLGWWRDRLCGECGHKFKSHMHGEYCVAYSEGELFNSCHCENFVPVEDAA